MEASQGLINEGQGWGFGLEEQSVVVAADFLVEPGQAVRGEVGCPTIVVKGALES